MGQRLLEQRANTAPFATLELATRRFRLRDATLSNAQIAVHLGLVHTFRGDALGAPDCCFFTHGDIVAIRTKKDEIAIFHAWQGIQARMEAEAIGDRIP